MGNTRKSLLAAAALSAAVVAIAGCSGAAGDARDAASPNSTQRAVRPVPTQPVVRFTDLPAAWTLSATGDECTALSWRYRPGPTGWAGTFKGDRIAVSAIVLGQRCTAGAAAPAPKAGQADRGQSLRPALRLATPTEIGHLEGVSAAVQYRFSRTLVGGCALDLRVSFARRPSPQMLASAQRVLDGARFARPTAPCPGGPARFDAATSTGNTCAPSATRAVEGPGVVVGRGPVHAGSDFGRHAALDVTLRRSEGRYVGKLFWLIDRDGPERVRVRGERIDAAGSLRLRVGGSTPAGDGVVLRKTLIARQFAQRNPRWIGAPGEVSLPAPGCYRLRARWAGGGWQAIIQARLPPRG